MASRTGGIAILVGGRFAWLLLQVVSLAVYYRVLGKELMGIAILVALYRGYMKLLDFEIPGGALQRLSTAFRTDEGLAWSYFRTTLTMQGIVAAAGAIVLIAWPHVLPLPPASSAYPAIGAMFAVAAFQHVTDTISSTLSIPYMARERFRQLAVFDSVLPMTFTLLMVAGVLLFRTPLALTIGTAAESLAGLLLKVGLYWRQEPREALIPRYQHRLAKEMFGIGSKIYITNLSSRIGSTADKVIIANVLGEGALTIYNTACRLPQVMLETFTRMSEAITPNMTAVAAHEPHAFAELLRKNALVISTVAATGIVAVGGLGTPLVQALFRESSPTAGVVVLLMALYYGMEQHFSTLTRGFFAQNKIAWMLPFTLWNTAITLLLTAPIARVWGISGVAAMNVGIDLIQFVPIAWVTVRVIAPDLALRPLLVRSATILATGFSVSLVFFFLSRGSAPGASSFAWIPFAWVPGAITLALLLGSGIGLMPEAVWDRLPMRIRRFRPAATA